MNKKEGDILARKFRERLADFKLPVSEDVWKKIERDLPPRHKPVMRGMWMRRISVLAACMLLLLGMGWYFSTMQRDVTENFGLTASETPTIIEPINCKKLSQKPQLTVIANGEKQSCIPSLHAQGRIRRSFEPASLQRNDNSNDESFVAHNDNSSIVHHDNSQSNQGDHKGSPLQAEDVATARGADAPIIRRKTKRPVTLALAYGNQRTSPAADLQGWYPRTFSEVMTLSEDLLPDNLSATDVHYDMPIAVSLSVRKNFAEDWALESGLTYTYLKSTETRSFPKGNTMSKTLRLHYLGVPLKLVYSIYDNHRLSLYASAGGMIEKCVSGRESTENTTSDLSIPELQWSLSGNVGVNYKLSDTFGLFVEPGINYYFDDHSGVQTIRKDKSLNIGVQFGLRLNY
ncbi:hypothetical protein AGMMS49525_07890 [Bacteroidia bacterium]|nr:hypothetical protein AGMMS49525_07890 [Bacteroidia bacterium]